MTRRAQAESRLRRHGYEPISLSLFDTGAKGVVFRAECESVECVIKSPSDPESLPQHVSEWYIQATILPKTIVNAPDSLASGYTCDGGFYHIMEFIDSDSPTCRWQTDSFLPTLADNMGDVLSKLHAVDETDIGGLPGVPTDPAEHVGHWLDYVRERVTGTPAGQYTSELEDLGTRYRPLYDSAAALVHGDIMSENVLYKSDGRIAGLVDWESTAVSDPLLDLAQFEVQLCESFSVFSPHEPARLCELFRQSYDHEIDEQRLVILKIFEHLDLAAGIHEVGHFVPWRNAKAPASVDIKSFHINQASSLLNQFEL